MLSACEDAVCPERVKYLERLKSLQESEMDDDREYDEKVLELMENLSL